MDTAGGRDWTGPNEGEALTCVLPRVEQTASGKLLCSAGSPAQGPAMT